MNKAAVFDYEGTLGIESLVWDSLNRELGVDSEKARKQYLEFEKGNITWEEFKEDKVNELNRASFSNGKEPENLLDGFFKDHYRENGLREQAKDIIELFNSKNYDTFIISHAPDRYSSLASEDLDNDYHIDTQRFILNGKIQDIDRSELYDKDKFVEEIRKNGFNGSHSYDEVVFVGNGKNDIPAAEEADKGFIITNLDDVDYREMDESVISGDFPEIYDSLYNQIGGGEV